MRGNGGGSRDSYAPRQSKASGKRANETLQNTGDFTQSRTGVDGHVYTAGTPRAGRTAASPEGGFPWPLVACAARPLTPLHVQ